jgi:hypothetical protein
MHYFFEDLIGLVAATPLAVLLILVPGFGIARLLERAQVLPKDRNSVAWSLLLGPVLLPAIDALLLRWSGMASVLLLHVALAAVGFRPALEATRKVPLRWWGALAGCWALAAWANLDFDWNGRLYQSLMVIDGVKHAAVISALANGGVPLHDPFFARPGIAGYYYYFYIGPALIHWIGRALIDSRAAFAAGTFVTFLAFPAMLMLLADAAKLIPDGARRRFFAIIVMLCCLSGLDLIGGLWIWMRTGEVIAQLDWWSEEVRWALTSILLVPHHVTAVIAVYVGCLLLTQPGSPATRVVLGGLAFATAFGCSVWIAVAAAPILLFWWLYERIQEGSRSMWALPLGGLVALIVSIPQLIDIRAGRVASGPPLEFYMRPLGPIRVLPNSIGEWIVHLAVTPGGYFLEFGIFALGTIAFLKRGRFAETRSTPIGRLLLISAPVALLLVTFMRSALLYNDFGWRAVWLAQVPTMVWSASILASQPKLLRSPAWAAAIALGLLAVVWDVSGIRLIRPYYFLSFVNQDPTLDHDLRGTYAWIDRNLPQGMMVQHNPSGQSRALDFGLYSDRPVPVADSEARLFGADQRAVQARLLLVRPIFRQPMPAPEIQSRASAAGAGALLLTSADPLWHAAGGPPEDWRCAYRSPQSCVMLLGASR